MNKIEKSAKWVRDSLILDDIAKDWIKTVCHNTTYSINHYKSLRGDVDHTLIVGLAQLGLIEYDTIMINATKLGLRVFKELELI